MRKLKMWMPQIFDWRRGGNCWRLICLSTVLTDFVDETNHLLAAKLGDSILTLFAVKERGAGAENEFMLNKFKLKV